MNKTRKMLGVGLAAVVMAGALVYYNFIDKAPTQSTDNFAIETYANTDGTFALDGNTVTLADQEGKVCVLNFWETWCQACVEELPEFNEVQEEYGDQVQIYAIAGVTSSKSEIQAYLNGKGWSGWDKEHDWAEFSLTFAYMPYDECLELGYGGILPRTMVFNTQGELIYEHDAKMSYEQLKAVIDSALE